MKDHEYNNFIDEIISDLTRSFPKVELTEEMIRHYFRQLKMYKLQSLMRAKNFLIHKRKFSNFPTIGEIVEAIELSKTGMQY